MYDIVEYSLSHEFLGTLVIEEPSGWENDVPEINKSNKNFSTVTKYSTSLEFVLSGASFINNVYDNYGFDADIILKKRAIHPTKSEVRTIYETILDGYTLEYDGIKLKINSKESKLISLIENYESEELEISNNIALNGNDIGTLKIDKCLIDGKDLLFISEWEKDKDNLEYSVDFEKKFNETAIKYFTYAIPFHQISSGDVQDFSIQEYEIPVYRGGSQGGVLLNGVPTTMFYALAVRDTPMTITLDINIDIETTCSNVSSFYSKLLLIEYEDLSSSGGDTYKILWASELKDSTIVQANRIINVTHQQSIDMTTNPLKKGHSLALGIYTYNSRGSGFSEWEVTYKTNKADLRIRQDSHVESTHSQTVRPFELFERLLRLMTGRTDFILETDYFGRTDLGYPKDGEGANLGVASGFWAREFNDKDLVTSWADAIKSYGVVADISYDIKKKGEIEYVKLEPLNPDFFTNNITILPNVVDDVNTKVSKEFSYSAINIGYEKGGDVYEEAAGLDEFNGKHSYTTPISKNKMTLELTSKYRGDMTGFEFARRKPKFNYPTEDTRYDMDIFFLDMKKGDTEILLQRKYADDFSTEPINIYSPETATNLRLSPKQLLIKHGWLIKNSLTMYLDKYIHFISATGNSKMILDGVQENDNYLINLLSKEKFRNIDLEFTHETNLELYDEIQANISGIFEFTDNKGVINKCRLFKFSKNKYTAMKI